MTEATHVDPLTWKIKLRPGVRFHNGVAMDAVAVKASLERTPRLSEASAKALGIESIVVNDEQTSPSQQWNLDPPCRAC